MSIAFLTFFGLTKATLTAQSSNIELFKVENLDIKTLAMEQSELTETYWGDAIFAKHLEYDTSILLVVFRNGLLIKWDIINQFATDLLFLNTPIYSCKYYENGIFYLKTNDEESNLEILEMSARGSFTKNFTYYSVCDIQEFDILENGEMLGLGCSSIFIWQNKQSTPTEIEIYSADFYLNYSNKTQKIFWKKSDTPSIYSKQLNSVDSILEYNSPGYFIDFIALDDNLVIWTKDTLSVFNTITKTIDFVIPFQSSILFFTIDRDRDGFIFTDGVNMFYSLALKNNKWSYRRIDTGKKLLLESKVPEIVTPEKLITDTKKQICYLNTISNNCLIQAYSGSALCIDADLEKKHLYVGSNIITERYDFTSDSISFSSSFKNEMNDKSFIYKQLMGISAPWISREIKIVKKNNLISVLFEVGYFNVMDVFFSEDPQKCLLGPTIAKSNDIEILNDDLYVKAQNERGNWIYKDANVFSSKLNQKGKKSKVNIEYSSFCPDNKIQEFDIVKVKKDNIIAFSTLDGKLGLYSEFSDTSRYLLQSNSFDKVNFVKLNKIAAIKDKNSLVLYDVESFAPQTWTFQSPILDYCSISDTIFVLLGANIVVVIKDGVSKPQNLTTFQSYFRDNVQAKFIRCFSAHELILVGDDESPVKTLPITTQKNQQKRESADLDHSLIGIDTNCYLFFDAAKKSIFRVNK
jgi:hypothetical protein